LPGSMIKPTVNPIDAGRLLDLPDDQLLDQCQVDCYRSQGPGGQKRNKTSSAVRIRHVATGLAATATEDRSQHVNRTRALRRLRKAIALNVRSAVDRERYEKSPLLVECIREGEISVGRRDHRYPNVLSEVLDVLFACDMSIREAGAELGVPTARLVKFIEKDPKLWQRVNELRAAAGHKPLR